MRSHLRAQALQALYQPTEKPRHWERCTRDIVLMGGAKFYLTCGCWMCRMHWQGTP